MNNNQTTERALLAACKGTFGTTSYTSIGTKECASPRPRAPPPAARGPGPPPPPPPAVRVPAPPSP